jgi:hypothetical protein
VKTVLQFYPREDGIWSLFYSFYFFISQDGLAFKIIAENCWERLLLKIIVGVFVEVTAEN